MQYTKQSKRYTGTVLRTVILLCLFLFILACDRPPEDRIFKDFNSIVKIHPVTNLPRPEWEVTKSAGYNLIRIYSEKSRTVVELELKKPYYGKKQINMYYSKSPDGKWEWMGWSFVSK